jgi:hypothetical protein
MTNLLHAQEGQTVRSIPRGQTVPGRPWMNCLLDESNGYHNFTGG